LRAPDSAATASKLGVQVGGQSWLVDLAEAAEVLPVPPVRALPLTKSWFRGVANMRGNLYSVVDFGAFLGGTPAVVSEQSRLLLLSERFRFGAALLVDRSLGLRNATQLNARELVGGHPAWLRGEYSDEAGGVWKELD